MLKIYTLKDNVSGSAPRLTLCRTDAEAMRGLSQLVNGPKEQNDVGQYPQDFVLYCVGEWDPTDVHAGTMHELAIPVANAVDLVAVESPIEDGARFETPANGKMTDGQDIKQALDSLSK